MVVLPEPFGPISPSTSFSARANDMLWTATSPPKRLVTSPTSKAVVLASGIAALSSGERAAYRGERCVVTALQGHARRRKPLMAMAQSVFDQADHAVGNEVHDQQERGAEQQGGLRRKLGGDQFPQQRERNDTEQRPPQPMHAAEQRHDHDLKRQERT